MCCTPLLGSFWELRGTIPASLLSSQWVRPSPSPSEQGDRRSGHLIARYGPSKSRIWDFSPFSTAWRISSFEDNRRKRQAFWTVEEKVMGGNAWWKGWVPVYRTNTHIQIYMTLSPNDYCLIPGNFAIKLVEAQNLL